jgi:DNA gyrase/topoisomerase IV subunit A
MQASLEKLDNLIRKDREAIQDKLCLQRSHQTTLEMPNEYFTDVALNYKELKHKVPDVVVTQAPNGKTSSNIYLMWDKLKMYGNQRRFTHNNYKEALDTLINDDKTYRNFKEKVHQPLKEIMSCNDFSLVFCPLF